MEKFQPTSKCSLILWICIAVVLLPLAVADSAARDDAPSSLHQREDNSQYDTSETNASKSLYWKRNSNRVFDGLVEEYWDDKKSIKRSGSFSKAWWDQDDGRLIKIFPEEYIKDGKSYSEFTCEAHMKKNDDLHWVRWYENPLLNKWKYDLFATYKATEDFAENITVRHIQIIYSTMNESSLRCCLYRTTEKTLSCSKNISFVFHTDIDFKVDNILINVLPNTSNDIFYFNDTTPLEINCFAWVDNPNHIEATDQFASWYQVQGSNRKIKLTSVVKYGVRGPIRLELTKLWKPSDNGTQIYCTIEMLTTNGTVWTSQPDWKSRRFTLVYRVDDCSPWPAWMSAAVAMLVVFLAEGATVALAVIICLRPKTSKTPNPAN